MPRIKEKLAPPVKPEKPAKAKEKEKKVAATNGAIDHRLSDSFPMIKLIDQRIAESVPKEIIDKVNAVTSKRQIICSTYPYEKCIKNKEYEKEAKYLQIELVKMQAWVQKTGAKVVMLFEGRDAAGKGGTIKRFTEFLNPRGAPVVALAKPSDQEKGQWYFQRYIEQLPTAGEIVFFDRSWYNRAGVEHVMGFCSPHDYLEFMRQTPEFERMLVRSGIILLKYWFSITDDEQHFRFQMRIEDPIKQWKLSPMDLESRRRWEEYTKAKEDMLHRTHIPEAPWWVVEAVDKKHARLNCISHLLSQIEYGTVEHPPIILPERVHNPDYVRHPVPDWMKVPNLY